MRITSKKDESPLLSAEGMPPTLLVCPEIPVVTPGVTQPETPVVKVVIPLVASVITPLLVVLVAPPPPPAPHSFMLLGTV